MTDMTSSNIRRYINWKKIFIVIMLIIHDYNIYNTYFGESYEVLNGYKTQFSFLYVSVSIFVEV